MILCAQQKRVEALSTHLTAVKSSCVIRVSPRAAGDAGSPADRAAVAVSVVRSSAFRFAADTCFTSLRTWNKMQKQNDEWRESCPIAFLEEQSSRTSLVKQAVFIVLTRKRSYSASSSSLSGSSFEAPTCSGRQ